MDGAKKLNITLLGISAAIPTKTRHVSSQVVNCNNNYYLIDCGEGTQIQLISLGIKYHKIDNIFISHLHGDHFFGLIGLISTYHLLGREKPLHIYSPKPLEEIIRSQLEITHTSLKFKLIFHFLKGDKSMKIFDNNELTVFSFPLVHRVPTYGFRFVQKPVSRNISKSFVEKYNPSISEILEIKNGEDFIDKSGNIIENKSITIDPPKPLSYAYCSDTKYDKSLASYVKNVDLLYHEATFDNSMEVKAREKFHSTAGQAARTAHDANVRKLILGHFSGRNEDLTILLDEAKEVFCETIIGEEGVSYSA